ncbi:MAG: hypothetical protein EBY20_10290 [Alphaproteobacteria bacterium]|nr:hypothetical protein [Alphaproteobacteria bacterium]
MTGILSRAAWSYGRGWARAINKHGKKKSKPIGNDEIYYALQEKRKMKMQLKLEKNYKRKLTRKREF